GRASEMRKKGHIEFQLEGEKLKGRWHLVRTRPRDGKPAWLLFKARDEHARAGFDVVKARPESVKTGRRTTRGPVRKKALRAAHPPAIDLLAKVWPPMKATLATP